MIQGESSGPANSTARSFTPETPRVTWASSNCLVQEILFPIQRATQAMIAYFLLLFYVVFEVSQTQCRWVTTGVADAVLLSSFSWD